jgi:hypothetical protein
MMSSTAWAHLILSPATRCTEHCQRRGAVLSGHITTVVVFRSGQLGRYCTI